MNRNRRTRGILICVFAAASLLLVVAGDAEADFTFGMPTNLGGAINTSMHETEPAISQDGLFICFTRSQPDWSGFAEAWVGQRTPVSDTWADPVCIGPWADSSGVHTQMVEAALVEKMGVQPGFTTADGLESYTYDDRLGGYGGIDLFVMKRDSVDADWGPLENLGPTINTSNWDFAPFISPDGLTLHFASTNRPGGYGRSDIWVTRRPTRSDPWANPTNLGPAVNSPSWDYNFSISPDGLLLFFASGRSGGYGETDIWMAKRASPSDAWEQAVNLGSVVNTSADDDMPRISPDGRVLYFCSNRADGRGGYDLWQTRITPIVDFNGDEIIDLADLVMLIDNWGTDDTLYDVGPMPWGDGVVDVEDLKVFIAEWEKQNAVVQP